MPLAVEKIDIIIGKVLHTRHTVNPNKYNKSLKSELNTTTTTTATTTNNEHDLLNEGRSKIKLWGD